MDRRINLLDTTILIALRIDSMFRLENLLLSVESLQRHFQIKIKILESDRYNNHLLEKLLVDVDYRFVEDFDYVFHRTKYNNILANGTDTPFISIWDADSIIDPQQVLHAVDALRTDKADVAFPYDGVMLDVPAILRENYIDKKDIAFFHRHVSKMEVLYKRKDMVGGAVFIGRKKYLQAGGDDENYYGWGNEDFERVIRWKTLGYRIFNTEGNLYHLYHPRYDNSKYLSSYICMRSLGMLTYAERCSAEEILDNRNNILI